MKIKFDPSAEWLEADGLGGFASGTVSGIRTRRYHALLLSAAAPPSRRFVLVNGLEVFAETPAGVFPLSSQAYLPDVIHPDGAGRIAAFHREPWPRWEYRLEDGTVIRQEVLVPRGAPLALISWRLAARRDGVLLRARPLISGRDLHALHHENPAFRFDAETTPEGEIRWRPYEGVPGIVALTNGAYEHAPAWYRSFSYERERERGLDFQEDLASPGGFTWDLSAGEAFLALGAEGAELEAFRGAPAGDFSLPRARNLERRRRARLASPLHRAAEAYRVQRGAGESVIAGYPWFGEWGRDTFIALRGLCLASDDPAAAGRILSEWAWSLSEGMLPSRFPDDATPEYHSVDASLWFVVAVHDFLQAMERTKKSVPARDREILRAAVESILEAHAAGTRHGIRLDDDGLLAAGAPGTALTWMDAKIGQEPVTPRIGKPVEVEALWLNALWSVADGSPRWTEILKKGYFAFQEKFWNEEAGCLYDVVDADHVAGRNDPTFRPNQILAVGGLPKSLLGGERARRVVEAVEERLLTPLGLRSLAPGEPGYAPRYEGTAEERDAAYHQGTVWPWLMGPFVEAWLRVRNGNARAKREARTRFLDPLLRHLEDHGLGHLPEIADADPPHAPRGCPFQAWSLGEALRIGSLLAETALHAEEGGTPPEDPGPSRKRRRGAEIRETPPRGES